MLFPAAFPCDIFKFFIQKLNRAEIFRKMAVKPDIFDNRTLLGGKAWEGVLLARLAAEGQCFEIVAVLTVFLFEFERPGGSFREILLVTV